MGGIFSVRAIGQHELDVFLGDNFDACLTSSMQNAHMSPLSNPPLLNANLSLGVWAFAAGKRNFRGQRQGPQSPKVPSLGWLELSLA